MGDCIEYKGEHLGSLHPDTDLHKTLLVMRSLNALETLLALPDSESIRMDSCGVVTYGFFKREYMTNVDEIYPTHEAWAARRTKGSTSELFPQARR